jgi:hypothetical protein
LRSLSPADRRALRFALAEAGPADGGAPGQPGPARATWVRLQALSYVDPAHPLPHPLPPAVTEAGLAALGLPAEVADPVAALRAAIRCLLPWRRPALRLRPRLPAVSIDDPDDEAAAPRVLTARTEVFAAVSAENERSWEGPHRCADTAWDAVIAWTARVGQPLDFTLRSGWRLVSRSDGPGVG